MFRRAVWFSLSFLAFHCDGGTDIPDDLTAACRRQAECRDAALGEAEPEGACQDRLIAEYDEASTYGCAAEHADWVSCLSTTRGQCGAADPCQGQQESFASCRDLARQ
ncbi:MAG: hypothetical protein RL033_2575 [Pseudomonadota bacterium]|jgi:hypothetical protein